MTEDSLEQMLALTERLREQSGGTLNYDAIQAISEATGVPSDLVRVLASRRVEKQRKGLIAPMVAMWQSLEPPTRRYLVSGIAATLTALCQAGVVLASEYKNEWASSTIGIIQLLWLTLGLYNACVAREPKTAAIVGGIFGGGSFAAYQVFGLVFGLSNGPQHGSQFLLVPITVIGAVTGLAVQRLTDRYRNRLGLRDPVRERQELLRQLTSLQERLKSGEQNVTFLSVDIVGSTRMKEMADPLVVEYTFTEYHQFVEMAAKKFGGRVHSTAGDGVTCAFESPAPAFMTAKFISAGLLELNTFRNKVGIPIVVRQGIHCGVIMAPEGGDILDVNFAHVIDIAAHLQKVAPPGSIVISDAAAAKINGGPPAIGQEKVNASGVMGTIWNSRPVQPSAAPDGPPPMPKLV